MVSLLSCNYNTRFSCFHIDSEDDIAKLPTHSTDGKDEAKTFGLCVYGSKAVCTNGKTYVLSGDNEWVPYQGAGGGTGGDFDNVESITDEMIYDLFEKDMEG